MKVDIKDINKGDVFSEESHYVVKSKGANEVIFTHLESGNDIALNNKYVQNLLKTSDQYEKEVEVTKEDSKDGTKLGIRSIFENIGSSEVFTVVFEKQGKDKTKKAIAEEKAAQRTLAIDLIEKAKKSKKSMAVAYAEALTFIQENPIKETVSGEDRVLRGYKIQFNSRDGKYNCIDVDLKMKGESNHIRPVNINTIKVLVVNGIKYIVK